MGFFTKLYAIWNSGSKGFRSSKNPIENTDPAAYGRLLNVILVFLENNQAIWKSYKVSSVSFCSTSIIGGVHKYRKVLGWWGLEEIYFRDLKVTVKEKARDLVPQEALNLKHEDWSECLNFYFNWSQEYQIWQTVKRNQTSRWYYWWGTNEYFVEQSVRQLFQAKC